MKTGSSATKIVITSAVAVLLCAVVAVTMICIKKSKTGAAGALTPSVTEAVVMTETSTAAEEESSEPTSAGAKSGEAKPEKTTGTTREVVDKAGNEKAYKLYKEYSKKEFIEDDIVWLADLTHDGIDDLIHISMHSEPYFDVYTVKNGKVEMIFSQYYYVHGNQWYITKKDGASNIVMLNLAGYYCPDRYSCDEFYLDNNGNATYVNKILKKGSDSPDIKAEQNEFRTELDLRYGEKMSSVYQIWNDDVDEHYADNAQKLNTVASAVFNK